MVEQKEPNFTLLEIQNKILKEMSWSILYDIAESVKKADIYIIIMVDKTSDVSNKEQTILCLLGRRKHFFIRGFFRTAWNGENQFYKYKKCY